MRIKKIRNFSIIAHIDHGKSTLADRLLQITGTITKREFREQYLDDNSIERERGITIKAKAVTINYKKDKIDYELNLIDTPGHVDFNYEVSRSLAACEGALLLIDATQGVQAQTVANTYLAIDANLEIIPIINKIDLPSARLDEVKQEIQISLGIPIDECILISAKTGENVPEVLDSIISKIPPPEGAINEPLKALIFDSVYDTYRGVITFVRIKNGQVKSGDEIIMMGSEQRYFVEEVGIFKPSMKAQQDLKAGNVGYIIAGIKDIHSVKIGDTITLKNSPATKPLPGYKDPVPVVFCGFYPTNDYDINSLKTALERLSLNDSSFVYEPETSEALGYGFRCGFLGLLHMDIVRERLRREENVEVIQTAPNVTYKVICTKESGLGTLQIDNPAKLPAEHLIEKIQEPIVELQMIIPSDAIGNIMKLCEQKRGKYKKTEYLGTSRVILSYEIPFAEIVFDFYDLLKSLTRGYGTMDYSFIGYVSAKLVKLRILVADKEVDALSTIVHFDSAERKGRIIIKTLKKEIPKHLFKIPLQAAVSKRIVARETISALSKHVTGKCYGGDITRKRKLWAKQKEGKKRMKSIGQVDIPQKAFMSVLGVNKNN